MALVLKKGISMNLTGEVEHNRGKFIPIIALLFKLARIAPGERPELRPGARADAFMISLPLYVYAKVMELLVPAEAALRRLIIMVAHGLDFTPPAFRIPAPRKDIAAPEGGSGAPAPAAAPLVPAIPAFQMFDPIKTFEDYYRAEITGIARPFPGAFPPARAESEPVSAISLWRRIHALSGAFNDLPGMAKLYLTWKARSRHQRKHNLPSRPKRVCILRPLYLRGFARRPKTDVHELLRECNIWAQEILNPPPWRKDFPLR
jgi:hypothetical protein